MRRYRFLFSARWIGLILGVAVLVVAFGFLARWQLGKNVVRSAENARIEAGLNAPARPVERVLAPGRTVGTGPGQSREWRMVTAHGRYDPAHQLLVRYRYQDGNPGYDVLTPLVTARGVLLVDRGWIASTGSSGSGGVSSNGTASGVPDAPAPPPGLVTVTGRVRASESGPEAGRRPADGQIRFVDSRLLGDWLGRPTFGGYVELTAQNPPADPALTLLAAPDLDAGPFLSYGVQWYLFAGIAIIGLGVLAYDQANGGKLEKRWRKPATRARQAPGRTPGQTTAGQTTAGRTTAGRTTAEQATPRQAARPTVPDRGRSR